MTRISINPKQFNPIAAADLAVLEKGEIAARRRAFLRDWIASRQRGLQLLVAGSLLFLPILAATTETADAQAGGPIPMGAIDGVSGATLNADGSVQLSLTNGQVISIPAAEVTVLADGTLALSAAAAEYVTTLAGVGAAAGGIGAATIAAGGAGLAVVAGLAGGDDAPPAPSVTVALSTARPLLNATEVGGPIILQGKAPVDSLVTVKIGSVVQTATADVNGDYSVTFAAGNFPGVNGPFTVDVKAEEVDSGGLVVGDPLATSALEIRVDATPPTLAISGTIAGDSVINAAEATTNQTISGTTDAENGQLVSVTLNAQTYQGLVAGGLWTVTVPAADLAALPVGALPVVANVTDAAGNLAAAATTSISADLIAPTVDIAPTLAGNNVFTKANEAGGLVVSGTTNAEAGQVVTVSYNGTDYTSAPLTGAAWSVTIPAAAFTGVATGDTIGAITARVSDVAGNPSDVANGPTINVDLTGPSLTIDPVAVDNVINIAESGSDVIISGTATGADGQTVTVTIAGLAPKTATRLGDSWQVTLDAADAAALTNGGAFTVTADVSDSEGFAAPQATRPFTTDYTQPTVTIAGIQSGETATPLSTDAILNAAETGQNLTISGTTFGVEDGQVVRVQLATQGTVSATVDGNAWSVSLARNITDDIARSVAEGDPIVLTATVTDAAGNPQLAPSMLTLTADLVAPTIAIDVTLAGNNVFTKANEAGGLVVSGTTNAEAGQVVTVSYNGTDYTSAPLTGAAWSVTIPAAAFTGVATGDTIGAITARVSDVAGNPSDVANGPTINVDLTGPSLTIDPVAVDNVINIAESGSDVIISGTATGADGQTVTVTIAGLAPKTATRLGDSWQVTLDAADAAALTNGGAFTVTADVSDSEGFAAPQATRPFTTDYTQPTVTIAGIQSGETATPLSTDAILNAAETGQNLTISGTTFGVEDGQVVRVQLATQGTVSATVDGNAWSVSLARNITDDIARSVAEGDPIVLTATVTDAAGNPQLAPSMLTLTADLVAPTIAIDVTLAGNNVFTKANEAGGLVVSGTTNAEAGQVVTVSYNGTDYTSAPLTGAAWSVTIPAAAFTGVATGDTIGAITARVSDVAGNPSDVANGPTINVDLTGPSLTIDPVAVDNVINIAESGSDVIISGTATGADGQTVTVTIAGLAPKTATRLGDSWQVTLDAADAAALTNGGAFTVTADVSDSEGFAAPQATRPFTTDYTQPTVTIAGIQSGETATPLSTDAILNAAETGQNLTISGTTFGVEDGQVVRVQLATQGTVSATVDGNAWSVSLARNITDDITRSVAEGDPIVLTATVTDAAGNPQLAPSMLTLTADLTQPDVTFVPMPFGASLNAADAAAGQTISGGSIGANGQSIEIRLFSGGAQQTSLSTTTDATTGAWSVNFSDTQLQALPQGALTIQASIIDVAGNLRNQTFGSNPIVDTVAPTLAIDTVQSGGVDVGTTLNIAERNAGVDVVGASDAEGRTVTVTATGPGGVSAVSTGVVTGGIWTANFDDLSVLTTDGTVSVSAAVSDAAGNAAIPDIETSTADVTAPTVAVDSHAVNGLITGTSTGLAPGAVVTVVVGTGPGVATYTPVVDAAGAWSLAIPRAPGADIFVGIGRAFNTQVVVTAAVVDTGGNPGNAAQQVTIYKEAGVAIAEVGRVGTTATYDLFQVESRGGEQFRLIQDADLIQYNPGSFVARSDFNSSIVLSDLDPVTASQSGEGDDVVRITMTDFSFPPKVPLAADIPIARLTMTVVDPATVIKHQITIDSPDDLGGHSETWIGTAGNDTIIVTGIASIVRAGGGNDTINLSAGGTNIVQFEGVPGLNGTDTIVGFQAGAAAKLPDVIGFAGLTNADLRVAGSGGTGTDFQALGAGGTLGADTGFVVLTTMLGDLTAAGLRAAGEGLLAEAAGDEIFLLATDGTDAALARVQFFGTDSASADVIANFTGLGDLSGITANEILGFTAP